jgi:hypothetical protein
MELCREQLFENITPAIYTSLAERVNAKTGVIITGNAGQASAQGYTVAYRFDPNMEVLSLQCAEAPRPERWFPGKIETKISQMVQDAITSK